MKLVLGVKDLTPASSDKSDMLMCPFIVRGSALARQGPQHRQSFMIDQ